MRYDQIYERINRLCEERGWSLYKLVQESGLPKSSLYNMMDRHSIPQLDMIQSICDGLHISLAEFFSDEGGGKKELTKDDQLFMELLKGLDTKNRNRTMAYMQALHDTQRGK